MSAVWLWCIWVWCSGSSVNIFHHIWGRFSVFSTFSCFWDSCHYWEACLNTTLWSESEVQVSQSCLTLCDPMDYTVRGILQARILEWVAFPFLKRSSQPRSPALQANSLPAEPQGKPKNTGVGSLPFSSRSSRHWNQTGVSCIASGFFTNWVIREAVFHWTTQETQTSFLSPIYKWKL